MPSLVPPPSSSPGILRWASAAAAPASKSWTDSRCCGAAGALVCQFLQILKENQCRYHRLWVLYGPLLSTSLIATDASDLLFPPKTWQRICHRGCVAWLQDFSTEVDLDDYTMEASKPLDYIFEGKITQQIFLLKQEILQSSLAMRDGKGWGQTLMQTDWKHVSWTWRSHWLWNKTRHYSITSFNIFEFRCAIPSSRQKGFPWRVGCILGPSGSGKSSNLKLFEGTEFDGFVLFFCVYILVVFQQIWWSHGISDLSNLFNLFSPFPFCFGKLFRFIWERVRPLMVHLFRWFIQYQLYTSWERHLTVWKTHDYGNHEVACFFVHRHSYQVIWLQTRVCITVCLCQISILTFTCFGLPEFLFRRRTEALRVEQDWECLAAAFLRWRKEDRDPRGLLAVGGHAARVCYSRWDASELETWGTKNTWSNVSTMGRYQGAK